MPPVDRVTSRRAFASLQRTPCRARSGPVRVAYVAAPDLVPPASRPQVAYAIGRRLGGAVQRNYVRRRVRSAIRERQSPLAPGAYLVAVTAAAMTEPYSQLAHHLDEALDRAAAATRRRAGGAG